MKRIEITYIPLLKNSSVWSNVILVLKVNYVILIIVLYFPRHNEHTIIGVGPRDATLAEESGPATPVPTTIAVSTRQSNDLSNRI